MSPLRTRKLRPTLFTLLVTGPALALMGVAVVAGATSVSAAAQPAGVAGPAHVAGASAAVSADSAVNAPIVLVSTTKPLAASAPAAGLSPQNAPIGGNSAAKPVKHKPDPRKHHKRKHHKRKHKRHARRHHHRHLSPRGIARSMLRHFGWSHRQFRYLSELWNRESSWNVYASNPYSGAYGIPQAVPGSKMASAGSKWRTSARTQIRWGMRYIRARYGSPRRAWYHEVDTGWY